MIQRPVITGGGERGRRAVRSLPRPFCKPGLEKTYGIEFGSFASLDSAGPQTKTALRGGTVTIGLVLSSSPY